jgi:hypothetical protein
MSPNPSLLLFCFSYFSDRFSCFCLGLPQTVILLPTMASRGAQIIGGSLCTQLTLIPSRQAEIWGISLLHFNFGLSNRIHQHLQLVMLESGWAAILTVQQSSQLLGLTDPLCGILEKERIKEPTFIAQQLWALIC